jgi:hypothetical protein
MYFEIDFQLCSDESPTLDENYSLVPTTVLAIAEISAIIGLNKLFLHLIGLICQIRLTNQFTNRGRQQWLEV